VVAPDLIAVDVDLDDLLLGLEGREREPGADRRTRSAASTYALNGLCRQSAAPSDRSLPSLTAPLPSAD
jgi:hypothetical protein